MIKGRFLFFFSLLCFSLNLAQVYAKVELNADAVDELGMKKNEDDGRLNYFAVLRNGEKHEISAVEYEELQATHQSPLEKLIAEEKARENAYWDSVSKGSKLNEEKNSD